MPPPGLPVVILLRLRHATLRSSGSVPPCWSALLGSLPRSLSLSPPLLLAAAPHLSVPLLLRLVRRAGTSSAPPDIPHPSLAPPLPRVCVRRPVLRRFAGSVASLPHRDQGCLDRPCQPHPGALPCPWRSKPGRAGTSAGSLLLPNTRGMAPGLCGARVLPHRKHSLHKAAVEGYSYVPTLYRYIIIS